MKPLRSWMMGVVVVVLAACGSSTGSSTATTGVSPPAGSTTTGASTTAGSTTTEGHRLQLLYISDSSGWGVAEEYARLASKQLGVPVDVVDWRGASQTLLTEVGRIRGDPTTVATADIIVLWGNPMGSGVKPDVARCVGGSQPAVPSEYTAADWKPFQDLFSTALTEIWTARRGVPVVLRTLDIYSANPASWHNEGIYERCTIAWETQQAAIRLASETGGAVFVSPYDVLNGVAHAQDPMAQGYIRADKEHLTDSGAALVAAALAATGFEPNNQP